MRGLNSVALAVLPAPPTVGDGMMSVSIAMAKIRFIRLLLSNVTIAKLPNARHQRRARAFDDERASDLRGPLQPVVRRRR